MCLMFNTLFNTFLIFRRTFERNRHSNALLVRPIEIGLCKKTFYVVFRLQFFEMRSISIRKHHSYYPPVPQKTFLHLRVLNIHLRSTGPAISSINICWNTLRQSALYLHPKTQNRKYSYCRYTSVRTTNGTIQISVHAFFVANHETPTPTNR